MAHNPFEEESYESDLLNAGTKVEYRDNLGKTHVAVIQQSDEDIKGDGTYRPGYDLDNGHWCFEDQITRVMAW